MVQFGSSVMTQYGLTRLAQAQEGESMVFTRIALGDGYLDLENTANVTELANERERFDIAGMSVNGFDFAAWIHILNTEIVGGYYLREMGLYIADPYNPDDRDRDMLYAVSAVTSDDGDRDYYIAIQDISAASLISLQLEIHTYVNPSANTVLITNPGRFVKSVEWILPDENGNVDLPAFHDLPEIVDDFFLHIEKQDIHVTLEEKARWNMITHCMALCEENAARITSLELRLFNLENGVSTGITGNAFDYDFENLNSLKVIRGIWVPALRIVKC
jgi:hypothetical protein